MIQAIAILLVAWSVAVLSVSFERCRFWWQWYQQRHRRQQHWQQLLQQSPQAASAWLDDCRLAMAWGEPLLQAGAVLAPLVGLIGTVIGLMDVLGRLGPQLLLPAGASLQGYGQVLGSTAAGLGIALVASSALMANQALRQWQLQRLERQERRGPGYAAP